MAEEMTEAQWSLAMNEFLARDDAQEFWQVQAVGGMFAKIWMRPLGMDFMANCEVLYPGNKRRRNIVAVGNTRARCLERLASACMEYLHPSEGRKNRERNIRAFGIPEDQVAEWLRKQI